MRRTAPRPVAVNVVQSRDGIRFIDRHRASREPHTWLALFQAAIDRETTITDDSLALIQQDAHGYNVPDYFRTDADRAAFLAFLKPRTGLYARLTELHDCGMLGQMVPEFQAIASRVIRDFYHKYTVDEHTLLTIRNLERLLNPSTPSRARFQSLLLDLAEPELLVLALLYHDVGKWRDDDHAAESVRMAQQMFERLQLPPASRDTVQFLISQHLQMSMVAFRRDTEDPDVVKRFASLVGNEERLKMLCLLTLGDVGAVSPGTLTPWREELLWRLYVDTYNHLTLQYADDLIERNQSELAELLANRPKAIAEAEIARFRRGVAASLPSSLLTGCDLLPRAAVAQYHVGPHPCGARPQRQSHLGAHGRHARQAVPLFQHLRRALVVWHGHPSGQRADQSERSRARHVPVHGPGALSRR